MADVEVAMSWTGEGLRFEGRGRAPSGVLLDGDSLVGPSPVETLLLSLASCMGADLIDISTRSRATVGGLEIRATGDRRAEPPRRYTAMRLTFTMSGVPAEDEPKVRRALELSEEKYCSVMHTLRPDLDMSMELVLEPAGAAAGGEER